MLVDFRLRFVLLLAVSAIGIASVGAQVNWYLGPDGFDRVASGRNSTVGFASFDYAMATIDPGDTLNVLPGTYFNAAFGDGDRWRTDKTFAVTDHNASPDAYTVIRSLVPFAAKLRGDGFYIFQIRNSSYIHVEGFDIEGEVERIPLDTALAYQFIYRERGTTRDLYRVPPGTPDEVVRDTVLPELGDVIRPSYTDTKGLIAQVSHHILIRNNHIHHAPGTGLRFQRCAYIRAEGNEIDNCSRKSYAGTHAFVLDATDDMDNSDTTKVWLTGNYVHDNYNEIYSWSPSKTIITPEIDEGKGISLQRNDAERGWAHGRMLVANNLTHDNGYSGLHLNNCRGIDIINNTSYHDNRSGRGGNHGISVQTGDDVRIINNIVVNDAAVGGFPIAMSSSSVGVTVDRNLVANPLQSRIAGLATGTLMADPDFVDPAAKNFRLNRGSDAIDAARPAFAPRMDILGRERGPLPDLGAYEFIATSGLSGPATAIPVSTYPNPVASGQSLLLDLEAVPTERLTFRLFDAFGRQVTSFPVTGGRTVRLALPRLVPGSYFLRAENKSGVLSARIVVVR